MPTNNTVTLVAFEESEKVARAVRTWLQTYTGKPLNKIEYNYLSDTKGLSMFPVQGAYKTKQYIDGSYEAQLQFYITYRLICSTADERLKACETLNAFGSWCEENPPTLGTGLRVRKITRNNEGSLTNRYEDGVEDYQIMITMNYEVNV